MLTAISLMFHMGVIGFMARYMVQHIEIMRSIDLEQFQQYSLQNVYPTETSRCFNNDTSYKYNGIIRGGYG